MLKKILILVCSFSQIYSINLRLLKGTTEVVDSQMQDYAPFNGVAFTEGLAENYYNLTVKDFRARANQIIETSQLPKEEVAKQVAEIEEYIKKISQEELSTYRLVSQMYHRAGGQFQLVEAKNNPVSQLRAGHMGNILRIIMETKTHGHLLSAVQEVTPNKAAKKEIQDAQEGAKNNLEDALKSYLLGLGLKKESGSLFKLKDFNHFIKAIITSLQESDKNNPQASFAPGTTEGILIGYALSRSNSKQNLENYLTGLTGKPVVLSDEEFSIEAIKEILQKFPNSENYNQFSDWLIAAFYQKNYMNGLPKISSATSIVYDNVFFTDCVETTIRNLCNIITHDGKSLGVNPSGVAISSQLANFYATDKANLPAEISNINVHQAWGNVIENMPGMAYLNVKLSGSIVEMRLPTDCDGFIPVDNSIISQDDLKKLPERKIAIKNKEILFYEKTVGQFKYLLLPENSNFFCYEVMPTLSNVVVSLNNLFDLKLYQPANILHEDFTQKNFLNLSTKLGLRVSSSINYNAKSINIAMDKDGNSFKIHLHYKAHGYVSVSDNKKSSLIDIQKLQTEFSYQEHSEKISKLISLFESNDVLEDLLKMTENNTENFLQLVRNFDIQNIDKRVQFITKLLKLSVNSISIDAYIARLIVSVGSQDEHYVKIILDNCNKNISNVIKASLKQSFNLLVVKKNIEFYPLYDINWILFGILNKSEMKTFLEKGINSSNKSIQIRVLNTIDNLGQAKILTKEEMMPFLEKGMNSRDSDIQNHILSIINEFGQAKILTKEEMMPFLEKGMNRENCYCYVTIFKIIKKLGQAKILTKEEMMPFLEKGMNSRDSDIQDRILSIINEFGQAKILTSQEMMPFLEKGMNSRNSDIQDRILSIINEFSQAKILTKEEMMPFLEKGMNSKNNKHQNYVLKIIENLGENKILTSQEMMPFLEAGMNINNTENVRIHAFVTIAIFTERKILTIQEIMPFLEKGIKNNKENEFNKQFLYTINKFFKDKMLTGKEIFPFLKKLIQGDIEIKHQALTIMNNLAQERILTEEETMFFLEQCMYSNDEQIQQMMLNTIEKLIEDKFLNIQEIIPFLKKGLQPLGYFSGSIPRDISIDSIRLIAYKVHIKILKLIDKLAEVKILKPQEKASLLEEAISFLQKGINSKDYYFQVITLNTIDRLAEAKILTAEEIMPLLKTAMKRESFVNKVKVINMMLKINPKRESSSGMLKSSKPLLMRHKPTIVDQYLKDLNMTPEEFAQKHEAYARSKFMDNGQKEYKLPDLESNLKDFQERQDQIQFDQEMYNAKPTTQDIATQRVQQAHVPTAYQSGLVAEKILPKTSKDVVRTGVRSIRR